MEADGTIGAGTIAAALRVDPNSLIDHVCDERLAFLKGLRTWSKYGGGWGRRVREVRLLAHKIVGDAPAPAPTPAPKPAPELKPVPSPTKVGLWAGIVTAAGAIAQWLGDHVLLTVGVVIAAAIVASFLLSNLKTGD